MQMILHFILFKKPHILNQSIFNKNLMYLQKHLQKWFYVNYMVLINPVKCFAWLLVQIPPRRNLSLKMAQLPFAEERVVLGVKINSDLIFYSQLKQLCEKVANKLNALTRIASYLSHNQGRLMCSYFLLDN